MHILHKMSHLMVRQIELMEIVLVVAFDLPELLLVAHVDAPRYAQVVLHFLEFPQEREYFQVVLNHIFCENGREWDHILNFVF